MANIETVSFLTREEMLQRLREGEDPWNIVFDKWNRIKKICKLYDISQLNLTEVAYGSTCVLCEIHTVESSAAIDCFGYRNGLLPCPLVQIEERCGQNAWTEFTNNPSVGTTQLMIDTLKRAMQGRKISKIKP